MHRRHIVAAAAIALAAAATAVHSADNQGATPMASVVTEDVTVTRTYDASPAEVWTALTTDAGVVQWWGPEGFTAPAAHMDVREGGTSLVAMRGPDGLDMWMTWAYTRVVPNQRLEYIQNLSDAQGKLLDPAVHNLPAEFPRDTATVLTLTETNGQTELVITEHTTTTEFMLEMSKLGLEQVLDKLGASFQP